MSKLTEKISSEIKEKKLKPRPKWQFELRYAIDWLMVAALLAILGSFASLALYFFIGIDLGLAAWLTGQPFVHGRAPLMLAGALLAVAIVAVLGFRHTRRGYRYNLAGVIAAVLVSSVVLAGAFSWLGAGKNLDQALSKTGVYQTRSEYMASVWQQPQSGRIAGEIVAVENADNFTLRDLAGKEWNVSAQGAVWRHALAARVGLQIKLLGSQSGSHGFEAVDIRPWMPMNGACGNADATTGMMRGCGMMR